MSHCLEYNSQRNYLSIPEYGRHIQKMVAYCTELADKDERNKVAHAIVDVMGALFPYLRDVEDYKHKLWDHLFIMSDFKLEVDSPYPKPSPDQCIEKPNKVPYPKGNIKYGHYGKIVQDLIKKAGSMEPGEERQALILVTVNLMKRCYITWNRDTVEDEVILKHLSEISDGKLSLKDPSLIVSLSDLNNQNKPKRKPQQKGKRHAKKRY